MIAVLWGIPLDVIITRATKSNHDTPIKITTKDVETE